MSNKQCSSPSTLKAAFEVVSRQVSLQETEESWSIIEKGIVQLTEWCNSRGYESVTEIITGIRSLSRPLNSAISSKRTKLSGAAIKLVTALLAGLGHAFEPLVLLFIPSLLGLCAQSNKVLTRRAKECVFAVIRGTKSPSILPYLAEYLNNKSTSLRLVAAEGVLAYLNCVNPLDIENDLHGARLLEDVIKMTARDASVDVRKVGAKIINAHKAILPDRIESSLQAQKTSGKRTQRQAHPLSSELPRDIRAVRLIAVSKKTTSARQGALPPRSEPASSSMQSKRRDVVCPSTSTSLRPQCVGNAMKARDGKPHVSEGGRRVQAPPKPSGTQIRKTAVATRTHSVTSVRPLSRTGPRPFAKAEHPTMRDTSSWIGQSGLRGSSTEVERQTLSQASCRSITASRSGQQAMGQKKPVWGGRPVTKGLKPIVKAVSNTAVASGEPPQADTPHVEGVSHPCIDTTASTCDLKNQDSHSASPQAHTSPISSIEGGFLCSPPHVPQVARRRSNRLPRTPRRPRRESIYMELPESPGSCIDDTPLSGDRPVVSCIQHDVPVPRDASRLSYIEIGRARNAKFQVFVDANPEGANTALVDRPSYMVDSLQGDATPPPLSVEAQPEAPHGLSASSPLNIQDLARSSSSPKGVSTIRVYRTRGLRRFDYTPELSLLLEVSFVSEA